jgi:adenylate kinase family enzyme
MRVPQGDKKIIKDEILNIFKHYSRPFWAGILYGRKPLTLDQMEAIEQVFKNHGIRKNIWG